MRLLSIDLLCHKRDWIGRENELTIAVILLMTGSTEWERIAQLASNGAYYLEGKAIDMDHEGAPGARAVMELHELGMVLHYYAMLMQKDMDKAKTDLYWSYIDEQEDHIIKTKTLTDVPKIELARP